MSPTASFTLVTLKANRAEAEERIATWAKAYGVTGDSIEETFKRFETELVVTVSGQSDDIDGLREELTDSHQSSGSSLAMGPLSIVIDPVLDMLGDSATARFKRWRRGREL